MEAHTVAAVRNAASCGISCADAVNRHTCIHTHACMMPTRTAHTKGCAPVQFARHAHGLPQRRLGSHRWHCAGCGCIGSGWRLGHRDGREASRRCTCCKCATLPSDARAIPIRVTCKREGADPKRLLPGRRRPRRGLGAKEGGRGVADAGPAAEARRRRGFVAARASSRGGTELKGAALLAADAAAGTRPRL